MDGTTGLKQSEDPDRISTGIHADAGVSRDIPATTQSSGEQPGRGHLRPQSQKAVHFSMESFISSESSCAAEQGTGRARDLPPTQHRGERLSSEDVAPNTRQPYPASPPVHPLKTWSAGDGNAASLSATPLPHTARTAHVVATSDEANVKSEATQTQKPDCQFPRVSTRVLSQPDLSVADSASTSSTKGDVRGTDGGGKESRRPDAPSLQTAKPRAPIPPNHDGM